MSYENKISLLLLFLLWVKRIKYNQHLILLLKKSSLSNFEKKELTFREAYMSDTKDLQAKSSLTICRYEVAFSKPGLTGGGILMMVIN